MRTATPAAPDLRDPFRGRDHTPEEHFRLLFWGGVLHLRGLLGDIDDARLPFLARYLDELVGTGLDRLPPEQAAQRWADDLAVWEDAAPGVRLPLRAVREAARLDRFDLLLWCAIGVVEEDPRFGVVIEALAGVPGLHRPTAAVLGGLAGPARARARRSVAALAAAALVEPDADVAGPGLRPAPLLWAAARGDGTPSGTVRLRSRSAAPDLERLLLDDDLRARCGRLRELDLDRCTLAARGPTASGRRTLLRALAAASGRDSLEPDPGAPPPPDLGPLATYLHAMPVLVLDPPTGHPAAVPNLPSLGGPIGVALPAHSVIADTDTDTDTDTAPARRTAVVLELRVPDRATRRRHWRAALDAGDPAVVETAAEHRLGAGAINRIARSATAAARFDGRSAVTGADIAEATRALRASRLDGIARRLPPARGWDDIAVGAATTAELQMLERRCQLREELDAALPLVAARPGVGVRALFSGASGTGKTLAARCLGGALGKDVHRLDLARTVDKYLGETEKNIDRALRAAEELDVVLVIDEGDALLGRRTDVRSSNDRYANLETGYLLQRLEEHDGIVVITTNAEQRIDDAFARRLDVVVAFSAPGPPERHAVWRAHLPPDDLVDPRFLTDVAVRCALTGGQIRNAVLHACLLALDSPESRVTTAQLAAAVRREYVRSGAVCPVVEPDRPVSRHG